jgi:DNA-binding transcriptional MocR family regulator
MELTASSASVVPAADVGALLPPDWVQGRDPLYVKLAGAVAAAIELGSLPVGAHLPPERALAEELFLSRSTVVAAYRVLRGRGLVTSRRGSGTWVRGRTAGTYGDEETLGILARDRYLSTLIDESLVPIDLTVPAPQAAFERLAATGLLAGATPDLLREATPVGYQPRGLPSFRQAVADYLDARGLPTTADDVLVTTGAQQAISLLLDLFLRPGDEIVVENPSFRGLIDALLFARGRVLPLPIDDVDLPSRLQQLVTAHMPRLVYLTPTCHNPTGTTLDAEVRRAIVRVAARHGVPVVEDTVLSELDLGNPQPYLAAHARREDDVILIGSLSKVVWGGLRVGWIRASPAVISRVARLKALADMGTSTVSQIVALQAMGHLDDLVEIQRNEVRDALNQVEAGLYKHIPEWEWRRPSGGRSLWVRLPNRDAAEFAHVAFLHGVAVAAGSTLAFGDVGREFLRLPFVHPPAAIGEACRRLADAWRAYVDRS